MHMYAPACEPDSRPQVSLHVRPVDTHASFRRIAHIGSWDLQEALACRCARGRCNKELDTFS